MTRFASFEDAALLARRERLVRAADDLRTRIAARVCEVEAQARWLRSDPLYQRLSAVAANVRNDLRETEVELARRGTPIDGASSALCADECE